MMKDKLEWNDNAMERMKYISILESIYLPDLEEYQYKINVERVASTDEAIEEARNVPFGATDCMVIFRKRYNSGIFTERLSYNKYASDTDIQSLVHYLELDAEKFWFLILFIYDYCESMFYQGHTMKLNPLEQLQQLVTMIDKAANDTMTLNFKAGKLKAAVDDTHALRFIADAIKKCVNEADHDTLKYLSRRTREEEDTILNDSPYIAYFAKMLLAFFNTQPQIRDKRKKNAKQSRKEMELVSRLVYFTRLSKKDSWNDIENETLKGYLKQYENYKYPNNISKVYPEFSI